MLIQVASQALLNALPFLMHDPDFLCRQSDGSYAHCTQTEACRTPDYHIDYKIHSLIIKHKAYCERRWMKITGQNILFVGSSLLMTLIINIMDRNGRRPTFLAVGVLTVLGMAVLLIFENFWVTISAMTVLYAADYILFTNFYVYATEIFGGKWPSFANSAIFFCDNASYILYILVNLFFSHYKQNYYLMTGLIVVLIPLVWLLTETPFHYLRMNDLEGLEKNLLYINEVNNKHDPDLKRENDEFIINKVRPKGPVERSRSKRNKKEKKREGYFSGELTWFKYVRHMCMLILCIIPNYTITALYSTVPDKLGLDSLFVSAISFSIVSILTYLTLMFTLHRIPRRKGGIIVTLVIILFCAVLLLFALLGVREVSVMPWIELVITMALISLAAVQFLLISRYTTEYFPTKLRALSISLLLLFGRMSMFIGNLADPLSERLGVHPFVFVGLMSIFILPLFWFFEETLNKATKS